MIQKCKPNTYCLVLNIKPKIILYCINHLLNTTERKTIPEFFLLFIIFMFKKTLFISRKVLKEDTQGEKAKKQKNVWDTLNIVYSKNFALLLE